MSEPEGPRSGAADLSREELARAFAAQLEHERVFKNQRYALGGPLPVARPPVRVTPTAAPTETETAAAASPVGASAEEDLASLQQRVRREQAAAWAPAQKLAYLQQKVVGDCQRCPLAKSRQHLVFGVGNPEAQVVFVGEAPGQEEDRQGEPFVGAAGQKLNRWIESMGLTREQVYIANVLKCRPPRNRDPHPREVQTCSPFLRAQLRAISPKLVVALGRFAGCLLLGKDARLYEMRGSVREYSDAKHELRIPLVVTYHPSYVLRRESESQSGSRDPKLASDGKGEEQKVFDDLARAQNLLSA